MTKNPSFLCKKRLDKEFLDISNNPIPNIKIIYKDNNILNLYCLIYDLNDEEYKDGEYIFNIKISDKYPFKPPDFYFLTPNGRFDCNTKLCFSNSSYHSDQWSPLWNIKTIILGFLSFFLEKSSTGIGHINKSIELKKEYAINSKEYNKIKLKDINDLFIIKN
jgi:ubiquitin-protein ligase